MARLVRETPRGRTVHELVPGLVVVGRDPSCDLRLDHASVSRRHALLEVAGGRVRLTDLRSTGGTAINGAVLVPDRAASLADGDLVRFGKLPLTFRAPAPAAARRLRPWQVVALGAALVALALGLAWVLRDGESDPLPDPAAARADTGSEPSAPPSGDRPPSPPPPAVEPEPDPPAPMDPGGPPEPEPEPEPERAPLGVWPPPVPAPVDRLPELLAREDGAFAPVRLLSWDARTASFEGADGRHYRLPVARLTALVDRADLGRRADAERGRLAPDDADGRLALARWCARHHLATRARRLCAEVLGLRPDDEAAIALRAELER